MNITGSDNLAEEQISIDYFGKIDIRTARVIECEKVQKSRHLLRIVVEASGEKRQIVSSISDYYKPEEMVGKTILVVWNLEKATIMGLESQGMLLAVEKDDFLSLLTTDRESPSGLRVS
ncbi:MAG: methionine--tRNA ligase subunit beta [Thermoplasmataceae archaeon]|jgi:methionine--tRNA ligase beta chain